MIIEETKYLCLDDFLDFPFLYYTVKKDLLKITSPEVTEFLDKSLIKAIDSKEYEVEQLLVDLEIEDDSDKFLITLKKLIMITENDFFGNSDFAFRNLENLWIIYKLNQIYFNDSSIKSKLDYEVYEEIYNKFEMWKEDKFSDVWLKIIPNLHFFKYTLDENFSYFKIYLNKINSRAKMFLKNRPKTYNQIDLSLK